MAAEQRVSTSRAKLPPNRDSFVLRETTKRSPEIKQRPQSPARSLRASFSDHVSQHPENVSTTGGRERGRERGNNPLAMGTPPPRSPIRQTGTLMPTAKSINSAMQELAATPVRERKPQQKIPDDLGDKSFFDAVTTDDEGEEFSSPKVARAEPRTSMRPKLVETRASYSDVDEILPSGSAAASLHKDVGPSRQKAAKLLGIEHNLKEVGDLTPFTEVNDDPFTVPHVSSLDHVSYKHVAGESKKNEPAGASTAALPPTPMLGQPFVAAESSGEIPPSSLITEVRGLGRSNLQEPPPPSPQLSFTPSSVIEAPSTPLIIGVLETLPSPMGGLGTIRGLSHVSALVDGLRSNPPGDIAMSGGTSGLHRALSAPPLPLRLQTAPKASESANPRGFSSTQNKKLNRRVTIRPADIKTIGLTHADGLRRVAQLGIGQHGPSRVLVREHIVSTPYPTRAGSLVRNQGLNIQPTTANGYHRSGTNPLPVDADPPLRTSSKVKEDGPTRTGNSMSEILLLNLIIAGRPQRSTTMSIVVDDRATFDDEQLFKNIWQAYERLIGVYCSRLSARRLAYITLHNHLLSDSSSEESCILNSLRNPSLGRRRKVYLELVRAHQMQHRRSSTEVPTTASLPRNPHPAHAHDGQSSTFSLEPSRGGSGDGDDTPASVHSASATSIKRSTTQPESQQPAAESQAAHFLTVEFHFGYSTSRIAALFALIFLLSVLATVLWIILGKPGAGPQNHMTSISPPMSLPTIESSSSSGTVRHWNDNGPLPPVNGPSLDSSQSDSYGWKDDAGHRVGTGILIGIMIFLCGMIAEIGWIWASRNLH